MEFSDEGECLVMYLPAHSEVLDGPASEGVLARLASTAGDTCSVVEKWGELLTQANVTYRYVFIDQGGRLWRAAPNPPKSNKNPIDLTQGGLLEEAFEKSPAGVNQKSFLKGDAVKRYRDRIGRLAKGTRGYPFFNWNAVEAAIGEPLTPKVKWAIERIGRVPGELSIVTHPGTNDLTITYKRPVGPAISEER